MKSLEKYKGCLIGGAVGDALGYTVEFLYEDEIFATFGKNGITEYSLVNGIAQISDDTQMTLFTANGLLIADEENDYIDCIYMCYKDWLYTQMRNYINDDNQQHISWLLEVPEMFENRAPGNTCINSIIKGVNGTIEIPINNSKGCGSVMRVAPIGLFFDDEYSKDYVDMIGVKSSALTHGHELGYIPSGFVVHIINLVSHNNDVKLIDAVKDARKSIYKLFSKAEYIDYFISLIDKAIMLSKSNISDLQAIKQLGEGWVAEETVAIALYCALKYQNDFEKAVVTSVNHNGDSDSTGAVTGNILGAYLGINSIPQKYIDNLELKSVILKMAEDLFNKKIS